MAQPSPGISARVTAQALDVLFKLEAEHLAHLLPARFGLRLAPIRRHLPTELPQLDLHLERLDHVFELEDGTILHLEFDAEVGAADLRRFVRYAVALLEAYPGRRVQTVVFCGPRTRQTPLPIDWGTLPYRMDCVLVGDLDGEATLARLRALAQSGRPWGEADRLDLVLLPLMRHVQDTEAVVREGLTLAEALPAADQPRAMGALLALAYHYVGEAALNRLVEGLMTTNLLAQVLAESMERGIARGIERGMVQGREEGRAEGERALLRRYLEQRFGAIPSDLEQRIASSDAETLTALFERALTATAIEAL
jgi:hypothetical protein